jgi:hypothetical protein
MGHAVVQWLRYCAINRKVAGLIPEGVIEIFHWHNPSCHTMALGSTQPLTEMSTRNISWGKRRPVRMADNLATFMCRLSLSRLVIGLLYLYLYSCYNAPTCFDAIASSSGGSWLVPEEDAVASIQCRGILKEWYNKLLTILHLLVHHIINRDARYTC